MAAVENKNVNPILALIANWFCLGILGYILIGQTMKGVFVMVAGIIGSIPCVVPGIVIAIFGLIDVYLTATAIQNGEEVDENEYKFELLYKVVKIIHKDAVFKG